MEDHRDHGHRDHGHRDHGSCSWSLRESVVGKPKFFFEGLYFQENFIWKTSILKTSTYALFLILKPKYMKVHSSHPQRWDSLVWRPDDSLKKCEEHLKNINDGKNGAVLWQFLHIPNPSLRSWGNFLFLERFYFIVLVFIIELFQIKFSWK